jgi:hypothetical protein
VKRASTFMASRKKANEIVSKIILKNILFDNIKFHNNRSFRILKNTKRCNDLRQIRQFYST